MTPPLTPSYKIRIARYYLSHLDMTERAVVKKLRVNPKIVDESLKYYLRVIGTKPRKVKRYLYEEMPMKRNDLHRFENLIY